MGIIGHTEKQVGRLYYNVAAVHFYNTDELVPGSAVSRNTIFVRHTHVNLFRILFLLYVSLYFTVLCLVCVFFFFFFFFTLQLCVSTNKLYNTIQ